MKKKALSLILTLAMCLTLLPTAALASSVTATYDWYTNASNWKTDTDGNNYYQLDTPEDLLGFADLVNGTNGQTKDSFEGKIVRLGGDIDMQGTGTWPSLGIGFLGTLDGGGHSIQNLTMKEPFFGSNLRTKATVQNLTFQSAALTSSHTADLADSRTWARLGIVCRNLNGTMENVNLTGCTITANSLCGVVGGLAAMTQSTSVVKNCGVTNLTVNINGGALSVGGAFGLLTGGDDTSIETVYVTGTTITGKATGLNTSYEEVGTTVGAVFGMDSGSVTDVTGCDSSPAPDLTGLTFVARIGDIYFETLQAAVNAASAEDTVYLLKDVALDQPLMLTGSVHMDGGNHQVTANYTSSDYTIRCQDTTGDFTITMENLTVISSNVSGSRALSFYHNTGKVVVELDDCTLKSGYYALNIAGLNSDLTVNVDGGKLEGYAAINTYSGAKVNCNGTTIIGHNVYEDTEDDIYQTVVVEAGGTDAQLTFTGCTLEANRDENCAKEGFFGFQTSASVTCTNCTFKKNGTDLTGFANAAGDADNFMAEGYIQVWTGTDTFAAAPVTGLKAAVIGGGVCDTLQKAIDAAPNGSTVKLMSNVDENVTIPAGKTLTLDLAGKTLNGGTAAGKAALTNQGTVTIQDSSTAGTGTIQREDTAENSAEGKAYYTIRNEGTMTIESGKVCNDSGVEAPGWRGSALIDNGTGDTRATLTITGGTFEQNRFIVIKNEDYGTLHISGGTFYSTGEKGKTVENWNAASITGGTFNGAVTTWNYSYDGGGTNAETTIGGTAVVNGKVLTSKYDADAAAPIVNLTGGTFNGALETGYNTNGNNTYVADTTPNTSGAIRVTGGTFANDPGEFLVPGSSLCAGLHGGVYRLAVHGAERTSEITTAPAVGSTGELTCYCSNCGGVVGTELLPALDDDGTNIPPSNNSSSESNAAYPVVVKDSDNGSVRSSHRAAEENETVILTVTPGTGWQLYSLTARDRNGRQQKLTRMGDGRYSFKMPASKVTVEAIFTAEDPFEDVPEDAYYCAPVLWAREEGITGGVDDTHFAPYGICTRAQIVTFLWRAAGCPEPAGTANFVDVPANAYYARAVAWAVENQITTGITATEFGPDLPCTRAQAVTFLFRYMVSQGMDALTMQELVSGYVDAAQVPGYAVPAFNWALANGVMQGSNGALLPHNSCTRAQIVTFLYRACGQ